MDTEPVFSRDGKRIAFSSDRGGNDDLDIWVMNVDGTAQTDVTNDPSEDWDGAYSPDGTRIVFESTRDGDYEIYKMKKDGSSVVQLTNNTSAETYPDWQAKP